MNVSSHMPWNGLPGPLRTLADRAALGGLIGGAAGLAIGLVTRGSIGSVAAFGVGGMLAGAGAAALPIARDIRHSQRVLDAPHPSQPAVDARGGAHLRVMSVNIRSLRGAVGLVEERDALNQISSTIKRIDPDVIVFQEVDSRTSRSRGADQIGQIAKQVGATDSQFVKSSDKFGGGYGQGIIVRHGLTIDGSADAHALPARTDDEEHRIATESRIKLPDGRRFTMVGTHVTTVGVSRAGQLAELESIVQQAAQRHHDPVILAGDFNDTPAHVDPVLTRNGLVDALTAAGVRPGTPERQSFITGSEIDHVFVTPGVGVRQAWITGLGMAGVVEPATDHRAVVTDVTLPAG